MQTELKHIVVYEYEKLWTHKGEQRLSTTQLNALQAFFGESGVMYYNLIHDGIAFGSYVGVIQVGNLTIEVLPKADRHKTEESWRILLVDMLHAVGIFNIHAPSSSSLTLKCNSILDLYFQLFVCEVEYLLHRGLVKKYRKKEGNSTALKGSLMFAKHLQQNIVHQERFYVKHTVYDKDHELHQILRKALLLLNRINTNNQLQSRIGSVLLDFPEVKDLAISESLFERVQYNRKNEPYRNAMAIARLLLLNYHPDLKQGRNDVLALMFDMNKLWEQFVYASLRKHREHRYITAQTRKLFWQNNNGNDSSMKPDIVINKDQKGEKTIVLDAKWKNLNGKNPTPDDLRQMYVYHRYFDAEKVALVYPGSDPIVKGNYFNPNGTNGSIQCSLISLPVETNIKEWQKSIAKRVYDWEENTITK